MLLWHTELLRVAFLKQDTSYAQCALKFVQNKQLFFVLLSQWDSQSLETQMMPKILLYLVSSIINLMLANNYL